MGATTDRTKGGVKEKIGEATGDDELKSEGRLDLIKGDLQKLAEDGMTLVEHALGTKSTP